MVTDKNQPKQRKNTKRHCPKFEKQTSLIFPEAEDLRGLRVHRVGEPLRVQAVGNEPGVLPTHLIEHEIGVEVDGGHSDMTLGL